MQQIFVSSGSGYADDHTFDAYEVIAEPVPNRDDRVFGRQDNGNGGCCYGSHSIKLAVQRQFPKHGHYLLVKHGGGTRVLRIPEFYDRGAMIAAILAMPEREQYALLYTLYHIADEAKSRENEAVRREWSQAFVEGRIKKSRVKQGHRTVSIEPPPAIPAPIPATNRPGDQPAIMAEESGIDYATCLRMCNMD